MHHLLNEFKMSTFSYNNDQRVYCSPLSHSKKYSYGVRKILNRGSSTQMQNKNTAIKGQEVVVTSSKYLQSKIA